MAHDDLARLVGGGIDPEEIECGFDGDEETVLVGHDGIKSMTKLAVLFNLDGDELWVPKSVLAQVTADTFDVAGWWAEKEAIG